MTDRKSRKVRELERDYFECKFSDPTEVGPVAVAAYEAGSDHIEIARDFVRHRYRVGHLESLLFYATKRLIATVPYNENPLPDMHKQSFSISRLESLFPTGEITLISEAAQIPLITVDIDAAR